MILYRHYSDPLYGESRRTLQRFTDIIVRLRLRQHYRKAILVNGHFYAGFAGVHNLSWYRKRGALIRLRRRLHKHWWPVYQPWQRNHWN